MINFIKGFLSATDPLEWAMYQSKWVLVDNTQYVKYDIIDDSFYVVIFHRVYWF